MTYIFLNFNSIVPFTPLIKRKVKVVLSSKKEPGGAESTRKLCLESTSEIKAGKNSLIMKKVVLDFLDSKLFVCAITAIRAGKNLLVCQVPPSLCLCSCHSAEPDIC